MPAAANPVKKNLVFPVGLFVFLAGYFLFWSNKSYNNSIYLFCCVPALYFLLTNFKESTRGLSTNPLFIALACFIFYIPLSSLWHPDNQLSDTFHFYTNAFTILLFILFIKLCTKQDAAVQTNAFCLFAFSAALVAIAAFIVAKWFPEHSKLLETGRIFGVTRAILIEGYGVAILSAIFLVTIPIELWKKILLYLSIILLIFILLGGSRITLLGFLLTSLVIPIYKRQLSIIIPICFGLLLIGLAFWVIDDLSSLFLRGEEWRPKILQQLFAEACQSLWFGLGLNKHQTVQIGNNLFLNPHNALMSTFHSSGILGVVLHLSVYLTALFTAFKNRKEPLIVLAFMLLMFGFIAELTSGNRLINNPNQQWLYVWLPIGMLLGYSSRQSKNENVSTAQQVINSR
ncbi:MAG: hypothetical protein R3E73_01290 [Porticoccaceae bacterium]